MTDKLRAADLFTEEQLARSRRYHRPLYASTVIVLALELLVMALVAFSRLGAWLIDPLARWPFWAQTIAFTALIEALTAAVTLPFSVWRGFLHERSWGFSTQTASGFAADRLKGLLLGLAFSGAAITGFVACVHVAPRTWPLIVAPAGALTVLALSFLGPVVIEPLFNRFDPLSDETLAGELEALAGRAQLPIKEVLVADASRRTRKANAYVSGLGRTRRLVLYDTLLRQASRAELELILAHELGHRRGRHLAKGSLIGAAGLAAFVGVIWALLHSSALRAALGTPHGAHDPRIAALVLLVGLALSLLVMPLGSALSRSWEREADRFSLLLTGDLAAFESTHRSLAGSNLSDLDPPRAIYLALFSHPTAVERIDAARRLSAARDLERPAELPVSDRRPLVPPPNPAR